VLLELQVLVVLLVLLVVREVLVVQVLSAHYSMPMVAGVALVVLSLLPLQAEVEVEVQEVLEE
jgi:hypothetical protein